MKTILVTLAFLVSLSVCARTWHNAEGNSFDGELIRYDSDYAYIERDSDRRLFSVKRQTLSKSDQDYILELESKEKVSNFLDGIPSDFEEAVRLSERKELPAYIFYRNKMSKREFYKLIQTYLMNDGFLEKIERRCVLVVIYEEDAELERRIGSWTTEFEHAPMMIFNGKFNQSICNFASGYEEGVSVNKFLARVEEQLTHAEDMR